MQNKSIYNEESKTKYNKIGEFEVVDPSIDEILDPRRGLNFTSKFELITAISKRAKQLNNNAEVQVKTKDKKAVMIALKEIFAGKVIPIKKGPKRGN